MVRKIQHVVILPDGRAETYDTMGIRVTRLCGYWREMRDTILAEYDGYVECYLSAATLRHVDLFDPLLTSPAGQ